VSEPTVPASLAGQVLVAAPELVDPNFVQSIIFLAQHDAQGALGFILNRPSGKVLKDMAVEDGLPERLEGIPVAHGGPVQTEQLAVVVYAPGLQPGSMVCLLGLQAEQLEAHAEATGHFVRAYYGYAGWARGQLEAELDEKAWVVRPPDATLFDERLVRGLWPFLLHDDQRWRSLLPHLPGDAGSN